MLASASGGGFLVRGWCLLGGVSPPGESAPRGIWSRGCVSAPGGGRAPLPLLWTESQTPVETLPWPNFVAAGNKTNQALFQITMMFDMFEGCSKIKTNSDTFQY